MKLLEKKSHLKKDLSSNLQWFELAESYLCFKYKICSAIKKKQSLCTEREKRSESHGPLGLRLRHWSQKRSCSHWFVNHSKISHSFLSIGECFKAFEGLILKLLTKLVFFWPKSFIHLSNSISPTPLQICVASYSMELKVWHCQEFVFRRTRKLK